MKENEKYAQDLENEANISESQNQYEKISEDINGEDQIDSGLASFEKEISPQTDIQKQELEPKKSSGRNSVKSRSLSMDDSAK